MFYMGATISVVHFTRFAFCSFYHYNDTSKYCRRSAFDTLTFTEWNIDYTCVL
jgi:hypothetical protein